VRGTSFSLSFFIIYFSIYPFLLLSLPLTRARWADPNELFLFLF
jgi:hypothetical protein